MAIGFWMVTGSLLVIGLCIAMSAYYKVPLLSSQFLTATWAAIAFSVGLGTLGYGIQALRTWALTLTQLYCLGVFLYALFTFGAIAHEGAAALVGALIPPAAAIVGLSTLLHHRSLRLFEPEYRTLRRRTPQQRPRVYASPLFYIPTAVVAIYMVLLGTALLSAR